MLLHRLDLRGISVSTGSACDSQNTKISHVLQAINLSEDIAKGTIRISLGKLNKEEDATYIADSLINILL
jgi:cysteine desulfurase